MSSSGHLVRLTWKSSGIIFNGTIAISAPNYNTVKPKVKLDEDFNTVRCSLEFFDSCVQLFEGIQSSEETLDPGSSQVLCLVIYFFGALVKSFLLLYFFYLSLSHLVVRVCVIFFLLMLCGLSIFLKIKKIKNK